jgi:prolyl-tRNA synthetase
MTTRMIGTLIMAHADDDGLVLPPRIAPTHIVILPITPKEETRSVVLDAADKLAAQLRAVPYFGAPIEVEVDRRDLGGGVKNWDWIKKGVPLRVELGPRDLESGKVAVSRRDQPVKAKEFLANEEFVRQAAAMLDSIQNNLLQRATEFRDANTRVIDSKEKFYDFFTPKDSAKPEIHGGFALTHWDGSRGVEEQIKNDLKVTLRCIPFDDPANPPETGTCPFTGNPSPRRVVWAKAY